MGNFNRGPRRDFNRGSGSGFRSFGPREMHKAVCSDCGQECEVPFKPSKDRPVYCRDCFMKQKGKSPGRDGDAPKAEKKEEFEEADSESESEDSAEEEEAEEEY
jgi:CxxC-x17-CxxC domain-containing protein